MGAYHNEIFSVPNAVRTATLTGETFENLNGRGLHLAVNVTSASTGSGTITAEIQGQDPASGEFYSLLSSTALSSTGMTVLKLYPGLAASSNMVANDILPRFWRWLITASSTEDFSYSVGANVNL